MFLSISLPRLCCTDTLIAGICMSPFLLVVCRALALLCSIMSLASACRIHTSERCSSDRVPSRSFLHDVGHTEYANASRVYRTNLIAENTTAAPYAGFDRECPVCLENYNYTSEVCPRLNACQHLVYQACLDGLLRQSRNMIVLCPIYRKS